MMTGSAFLKRLKFQLDFLSPEDQKTVLAYYEKQLAETDSEAEEESLVKSFGAPESVAKELKKTFSIKSSEKADLSVTQDSPAEESEKSSQALSQENVNTEDSKDASEAKNDPQSGEQADLIFSKPVSPESSPEIIQSFENKETQTLFGEKVVIKERQTPIEEIPLEPIDEANGLTAEEIKLAKEKTLEKAQSFDGESHSPTSPEAEIKEAEAAVPVELDPEDAPQTKEFTGVFKKLLSNSTLSPKALSAVTILLSVLAAPLLILAFGAGVLVYAALSLVVIILSLLAFALIAAVVICGVIELIYGCALLFESVPVALIELGLGTILFALVTAISAFLYEFLFGIVPKILKFLTVKFKRYMLVLYCYLYGGIA